MKLIGEDANYISINGFIDQNSLEPFLNINGIDSIDVNGKLMEKELSSRASRNRMTRAKSIAPMESPKIKTPKQSNEEPVHHLRSRKQINYALSPLIDEDSLETFETFSTPKETRGRRSLKSSKPLDADPVHQEEVWNSGRPKRSTCMRSNKNSPDEKINHSDNKPLYKVEVMTPKLRSNSHTKEVEIPKPEVKIEDDKGLIVKFKKLRNSELTLLNNEAENFLFPKKDDSSEEDDDNSRTVSSYGDIKQEHSNNSEDLNGKFRVDDENSFDSTCSSRKKKRRTHAEAFIMDNQKYYKFETPGSRLRYQGSIFSDFILKSPKHNGFVDSNKRYEEEKKERKEKKRKDIDLNHFKYSFESVPKAERWYEPFRRQDLGEESCYINEDLYGPRLVLPYQIGPLPPLDPKVCINSYLQLKKLLQDHASSLSGSCTPESSLSNDAQEVSEINDDERLSEASVSITPSELCSDNSNQEELKTIKEAKKIFKKSLSVSSTEASSDCSTLEEPKTAVHQRVPKKSPESKNPRKSPRQHASTLAILSNLIHQRKKRKESKSSESCPAKVVTLPTIPEEVVAQPPPKTILCDYEEILRSFDQDSTDTERIKHYDIDTDEDPIEFRNSLSFLDVIKMFEENQTKEDYNFKKQGKGTPGRKPGRRKKKNRTGWPNRKRIGLNKKGPSSKDGDDSTNESEPTEDSGIDEPSATDRLNSVNSNKLGRVENKIEIVNLSDCDEKVKRLGRPPKRKYKRGNPNFKRIKLNNNSDKIVSRKKDSVNNVNLSPKRTAKKRRMPGSPKSPRMLRKPRGRWYKER